MQFFFFFFFRLDVPVCRCAGRAVKFLGEQGQQAGKREAA